MAATDLDRSEEQSDCDGEPCGRKQGRAKGAQRGKCSLARLICADQPITRTKLGAHEELPIAVQGVARRKSVSVISAMQANARVREYAKPDVRIGSVCVPEIIRQRLADSSDQMAIHELCDANAHDWRA